jgi:glycerol-3-phosphate dehydrogenase
LVTRGMLERAALDNPTVTLDDLRRDVRLGMGPCQGGFCTYRAAGVLHELAARSQPQPTEGDEATWDVATLQSPAKQGRVDQPARHVGVGKHPNLLLRDFLQERWKGVTSILWGQQLKQERLDEFIYLSLMNADHLPVDEVEGPLSDFYRFNPMPDTPESDEA